MRAGAASAESCGETGSRLIDVLNDVFATEMICYLRCSQHAAAVAGLRCARVVVKFEEHAADERKHASWTAQRVSELGGTPDLNPAGLARRDDGERLTLDRSHLTLMLSKSLVTERIVIVTYREIAEWIGDSDPVSRRLIEEILIEQEEYAHDLKELLGNRPAYRWQDGHQ